MKIGILISLVVIAFSSKPLQAQIEAPYLGATWYYDYNYPNGDKGVATIVLDDTVRINDTLWYSMDREGNGCETIDADYIRYSQDGSKMYYWGDIDSTEHLLYDFSKKEGESYWVYQSIRRDSFQVFIDSTTVVSTSGQLIPLQYESYGDGYDNIFFNGIYNIIGGRFYLTPVYGACDGYSAWNLRCFTLGDSTVKFVDHGCEEYIVGISEHNNTQEDWSIQAQNQQLTVRFKQPATGVLTITDISGRHQQSLPVTNASEITLPTNTLTKGIYTAQFQSSTSKRYVHRKFILE